MLKVKHLAIATAAAAGLTAANVAMGAAIGVNFNGGNNGGGASVTGTAGLVPQGNWNNEDNNTGSGAALNLDTGSASGATLSWTSPNVWASGQAGQNQNGVLMQGYLDVNDNPLTPATATITNLPSSIAGTGTTPYSVIVYIAGDSGGRAGDYTVNGTTINAQTIGQSGNGVFVPASSATPGNYVIFTGVTGTTLNISSSPTNFRAPLDGFQVISGTVPEPAGLGLLGIGAAGLLARRRRGNHAV